MLPMPLGTTLGRMTISYACKPAGVAEIADVVVLDGSLFFQPLPVVAQARRYAHNGVDLVVTMPLDGLATGLSGVSTTLLEASVETRLRDVLMAAGFAHVHRRHDVPGALVLDARA